MNDLVSIVIPTHNRKTMVTNLIKSLLLGTYENIEIIVIDDASRDGTYQYLATKFKEEKKVIIKSNKKNLFAAGSKNVGMKYAQGKYVAFIDDDNIADKRLVAEMVKAFNFIPMVGMVGPVNYVMSKKNKVLLSKSYRSMWTTKTTHVRSLKGMGKKDYWEADDIPNAFMVRANVVNKHKILFRSKFGIMYEESDYAYRVKQAGYKIIYCRSAKIYHDVDLFDKDFITHFLNDPRRAFTFARNRILFHAMYSSRTQFTGIVIFWCWVFNLYYCFKFLTYSKDKNITLSMKVNAVCNYSLGTIRGIILSVVGSAISYLQ